MNSFIMKSLNNVALVSMQFYIPGGGVSWEKCLS